MTYNLSKDLADMLVANGIGTFGTNIFIGKEPTSPAATVTLYRYGGQDPMPNLRLDYPSVQIRVRGDINGYVAAEQKMQSIRNVLLGADKQTINTNVYVGIWQIGDIIFLKYDENERPIFVTNWRIAVQPNITDNREPLG